MNVLHICSYYLGTKLYQNLTNVLEQNGINNKIYVPVTKETATSFTLNNNVDVSYCLNKYDRVLFHYKHNKIMRDIYLKYKLDKFSLIHAHSLFSNGYVAWQIHKKYDVPYIVAVRNTDMNVFFRYMLHLRGMGIEILKKSQRIVFLSEVYKDELLKKYIPEELHGQLLNKSEVIPNGIDEFWLNNKNDAKLLNNNKNINIVTAGTIEKNKNQLTTIKVAKKLISLGYDVKYTIVGRVMDNAIYKKLKKEHFVNYIPNQPKETLMEMFRKDSIFIMPSINETFGLVYAEAMSQGLPIIYTMGQGFDKQFKDGEVGYPVNCFAVDEIVEKIIRILDDYNAISERCIRLVDKFDWNTISKKYINIYSEVYTKPV
jgi:glycosyltransferase involved in cell wall biosynthesis